jgi:DNA mismatch repair protein MutH
MTTDTIQSDKYKTTQINQILAQAKTLRGYSLTQLTDYLKLNNPPELVHAKGLTGQIMEWLLGATAKSEPIPDFPELNLELKTIPISLNASPLETTYVCTAPLLPKLDKLQDKTLNYYDFKSSVVYKKLTHVLWLPIICLDNGERFIGNAFLWQPDATELKILETDWLELTDMMYTGELDKLSSHYGQALQIRPKAADSSVLTTGIGSSGNRVATLPRGFYLRTSFTKEIINQNYHYQDILP